MARRIFRRAGTVVLSVLLAVGVVAGNPSSVSGRPAAELAAERGDPKWYQVRSSYQGQPEFLYEIAERFLGDGDRLTEIFRLNKGRVQADGLSLVKPESIEPGWILILPGDAKGDGVRTGPLPIVPSVAPSSAAPTDAGVVTSGAAATAATTAAAVDQPGRGSSLPLILLIAVALLLIAAGAGVLLIRRSGAKFHDDAADRAR